MMAKNNPKILMKYLCYWLLSCFIVNMAAANPPNFLDAIADNTLNGQFTGFDAADIDILPPEQAFHVNAILLDTQTLQVHFEVADDIYLYREQFGFQGQDGARLGEPELPEGLPKDDILGHHEVYYHDVSALIPILATSSQKFSVDISYQGCSEQGFCYAPTTQTVSLDLDSGIGQIVTPMETTAMPIVGVDQQLSNRFGQAEHDRITQLIISEHIAWVMLAFLGFGLLLTFTPCVLPMVPILSSVIVGHGETVTKRKAFTLALVYVLAMAITYTIAGILIGLAGANLQVALQTPWALIVFSGLFVLLALSMFGFYDIKLPGALQNLIVQISRRQQGGRYMSTAVLGVFSALIVSPCITPPLVGALAYIGQTGDAIFGGFALFALGLGMGIPLIVGATIGAQYLPHAGPWMNKVKALFGVLLLGVAVWLLARIVPGSVELVLWAALLMVSAIYLGALDKVAHGWPRLWKGIGCFMLAYSVILLIGASLGHNDPLRPLGQLSLSNAPVNGSINSIEVKTIKSLANLEQELMLANQLNKPVMLDFYADWCVACIVMQRTTFVDPQVQQALQNFIILEADVTANDAIDIQLQRNFDVYAPPAILFFTPDGSEIKPARIVGEMGATSFYTHINHITDVLTSPNPSI